MAQFSNFADFRQSQMPLVPMKYYTILPVRIKAFYHAACRISLIWRINGGDSVSNHQPHDYLLNRLFRRRSKKTSKLRVTGLCAGNSPGTGKFPAQMASYAENVSIWWRHHDGTFKRTILILRRQIPIGLEQECHDDIIKLKHFPRYWPCASSHSLWRHCNLLTWFVVVDDIVRIKIVVAERCRDVEITEVVSRQRNFLANICQLAVYHLVPEDHFTKGLGANNWNLMKIRWVLIFTLK